MTYSNISPAEVQKLAATNQLTLVDIRERDEFARESIQGGINMPMSELTTCDCPEDGSDLVFYCRSGRRTEMAAEQLSQWVGRPIRIMEGGIEAWRAAGLTTKMDKKTPLELNRQVQIAAGVLILVGTLGAVFVHSSLIWLAALVGAGLIFTGVTGNCAMASLLMLMPWNRPATA